MITTLSFVACLLASPTDCKTVHPMIDEPLNPITCQLYGQTEGAKWVQENRGYKIDKIRCTTGNRAPPKEHRT